MANETTDVNAETRKFLEYLQEMHKKNSEQLEQQKKQAQQINDLYKERITDEHKLADFAEVIAQNNKIASLEAQRLATIVEESLQRQASYQADLARIKEQEIAADETRQKIKEDIADLEEERASAMGLFGDYQTKRLEEIADEEKRLNAQLETNKDLTKELGTQKTVREAEAAAHLDVLKAQKEAADEQERTNKANGQIQSSTRNVIKTLTGVTDQSSTFLGSLLDSDDAMGQIGDTMKATFTAKNMGLSVLTKIFQSTLAFMKEFDTLSADFRKNTGIIDKGLNGVEQRVVNVQRANIRMGVSLKEAFGAQTSLTKGMAEFTSMSDEAQASVLQATTIMGEFGVSSSTTAEIFNKFSKGLGYNGKRLEKLSTQIMGVATSLKVPPEVIATDFNMASKTLMKYGDGMMAVFKGLAEQSKQTGLAMSELIGIAEQFDTFEGAGNAVGKLNAILGGPYLNSINMLYASEEERIKQMRQSIALSGRQYSDLSRFEQQAIASAAGITDMSVAARLFGGTASEFADTQMSMKEMQERAVEAQAVQEKFTQVMMSFAIAMGPVVHLLGYLMDGLLLVMNVGGEIVKLFGSENSGLIGLFGALTPIIYAAAGAMFYFDKTLFGIRATMAQIFVPITVALVTFGTLKAIIDDLSGGFKIFAGAAMLAAGAVAIFLAYTTGGYALPVLAGYGFAAGAIVAGAWGMIEGIGESQYGHQPGQDVGGNATLIGEKGSEMVVAEDGSRYMVNSPSVVQLGTQDTVYTAAQTEAIMSAGSSRGTDGAQLAQMRASQEQFMQSMREERRMLKEAIARPVVAELDGKKIWKNQKGYMQKDSNFRIV